jgi:hypothetical protein
MHEPQTERLAADMFRHSLIQGLLLILAACIVGGAYLMPAWKAQGEVLPVSSAASTDLAAEPNSEALKRRLVKADNVFQAKDWDAAIREYRAITQDNPRVGVAWHRLAYALHMQGNLEEAIFYHEAAAKFEKFRAVSLYNLACAYSLKKEKTKALQYLRQAINAGFCGLEYLDTDTDLNFIRSEPEFQKMREEVRRRGTQAAESKSCDLSYLEADEIVPATNCPNS